VLIFPPIDDFAVLDFFRVKEILDASSGIGEELKRGLDRALNASR
jgi:predicted acylesterase/phospholipase RssA